MITSRARAGSRPARWPTPSASAVDAAIVATSMLFTSFATRPRPTPPQWTRLAGSPIASSAGAARSSAAASPPAITASVPAAAPTGPPLTGQSRYETPRAAHRPARSRATAGAMVLISTSTGGGEGAASMASTTSTTSGESVTHEHARSAPSTASAT